MLPRCVEDRVRQKMRTGGGLPQYYARDGARKLNEVSAEEVEKEDTGAT